MNQSKRNQRNLSRKSIKGKVKQKFNAEKMKDSEQMRKRTKNMISEIKKTST